MGRSRPHRRTRYWARRCGRSRPGLSVDPCLHVGPQRDPVRGPHLVTVRGLLVDNGPIARTSRSAQLAWTFRSARIGIVRTIVCGRRRLFPLGYAQVLVVRSVDRRLTFIVRRSIFLVSLWLSWPLTSVIHTMRRHSNTSPSGHAARNTRTTARFVAWSLNAGTSARGLGSKS